MLQPKKTKFRKMQKGKMKGNAQRGHLLAFGSFGIKAPLKYSFTFQNEECIIVFGEYQSEQQAIAAKNLLSQKFIEFPINYFFLPNQSNSKKEVYKIYLGPIKGLAKATQWSKMINQESIILEY